MKYIILTSLILINGMNSLLAHTKFDITYHNGYGEKPTYSEIPQSNAISVSKLESIFDFILNQSNLEFDYSYGSCEDRAHAISLMLSSMGIDNKKVWNFDPYYISLFNAQQQLNAADKSKLNTSVYWGFHVAVMVLVKQEEQVKLVVIDPAIAAKPIEVKKWLNAQNAPSSYYLFTDSKWLSFITINGFKFNQQPIPTGFPSLLTGDFYQNTGKNYEEMWVAEGLAINDIAMKMVKEIVRKKSTSDEKRTVFKNLIANIDNLTDALKNKKIPDDIQPYKKELALFQQQFILSRKNWKEKLDTMRNN